MNLKKIKFCSNCSKGKRIPINNDILCKEKGVVSSNYVCAHHEFSASSDPLKDARCRCIECENFIIEDDNYGISSTIGLCQLFTYRKYDGTLKNACSKFAKKRALEVS
ncbi:MAG: hypothetical protein QHH06_10535 [Clostridiales bacterium]|jgi:hypothetical protein|nr:hypothetical protein [Eubacteriales bacterium]MDH7566902.1 hypothetical protein [Clostridiales bacterium]